MSELMSELPTELTLSKTVSDPADKSDDGVAMPESQESTQLRLTFVTFVSSSKERAGRLRFFSIGRGPGAFLGSKCVNRWHPE